MLSPAQKLATAVMRIVEPPIAMAPYFSAVLRGLIRREMTPEQEEAMAAVNGMATLGVTADGILWWSPTFVSKLDTPELAWILCHEVMHVLLKHFDRAKACGVPTVHAVTVEDMTNARLFNLGGDLAINSDLREMNSGAQLPAAIPGTWCYPELFKLPPKLTTEEYYKLLQQQRQAAQKAMKGRPGAGNCGGCAGNPMAGEKPAKGEVGDKDGGGRSEAEMERMRKQVAEDVKAASESGKLRGTLPSSLVRWASDYLAPPKVDWRAKLSRLVRGAVAYRSGQSDLTWSKVSRRQGGVGYGVGRPCIPALHSPVPSVCIIVDTSGSMGTSELNDALIEVNGVLRTVNSNVTVVACDAEVHGIKKVRDVHEAAKMLKGGGGTAMAPAIKAVGELKERISVCICITDGYVDHPPEPPFSMIWCIVGENKSFSMPYGDVVIVEE